MGSLAGKRILVVEDEPILAICVEDMLSDLGCVVVGPAMSTKEAKLLACDKTLDAALLDINMGDGATFEIAKILCASSVPFCFATGYGAAGVPDDLRGTPVLSKPYTGHSLEAALRGLIGQGGSPRRGYRSRKSKTHAQRGAR